MRAGDDLLIKLKKMSSFKGYLLSSHFPSRLSVVKLTESLIHFIFPVIDDAKNYQKEEVDKLLEKAKSKNQ